MYILQQQKESKCLELYIILLEEEASGFEML